MLATLTWRFFRRHPGQLLALLLCLSTGVGAFVAIALVNQSALSSFERAADAINGAATHRLEAQGRVLNYSDFVALKRSAGAQRAAPVLESVARVGDKRAFKVLSVDAFSERALGRSELIASVTSLTSLLDEGALQLLVSRDLALTLPKGRFALSLDGLLIDAIVAGTLPSPDLSGLALADLGGTFAALKSERLTRIDLALTQAQLQNIRLPSGLSVVAASRQDLVLRELTRALRTNLLALSLLALLVSVFLISLSFRYAWLLRARDFARLRSLGLSAKALRGYLLGEALLLGLLGGACGIGFGVLLGQLLSAPLGDAFADLYGTQTRIQFAPSAVALALSLLLAMLAAVVGAIGPLISAERSSLGDQLKRSAQESKAQIAWGMIAALVLFLSAAWLLGQTSLELAFAGLLAAALGLALLVPLALRLMLNLLGRWTFVQRTLLGGLSIGLAQRSLSRLGAALAALTVALATPVGLDLMVSSFRGALIAWLDASVIGDQFVLSDQGIRPQQVRQVQALDGVLRVHTTRHRLLDRTTRPYELMAIDASAERMKTFQLLSGRVDFERFARGDSVLISEAFAAKRRVNVGDSWRLGASTLRIDAVFRDYRSEHGVVAIASARYRELYNDPLISSLNLITRPNAGLSVANYVATQPSLRLISRAELKATSLKIFDRTFALTDQLKYLTAALAAFGVFAALLALALEREGLHARLHALGFQRGQIHALNWLGALGLALLSGVLAAPLGIILAKLLTEVINQRAFGWSYALRLSAMPMINAMFLALAATALALLAAQWLSPNRGPSLRAVRE